MNELNSKYDWAQQKFNEYLWQAEEARDKVNAELEDMKQKLWKKKEENKKHVVEENEVQIEDINQEI